VLLTRSLLADASVIILADPTVGVDVGARRDIHGQLARFAAEGRSVIVSSSEPEELAAVADRVLVLARGEVSGELTGDALTPEAVVRAVTVEAATALA
jgi:ribose transport system ATP-binding protein